MRLNEYLKLLHEQKSPEVFLKCRCSYIAILVQAAIIKIPKTSHTKMALKSRSKTFFSGMVMSPCCPVRLAWLTHVLS